MERLSHSEARITENRSRAAYVSNPDESQFVKDLRILATDYWRPTTYAAQVFSDVYSRILAILGWRGDRGFSRGLSDATPRSGWNGEPVPVSFKQIAVRWTTKGTDETKRKQVGGKLTAIDDQQHTRKRRLFTIVRVDPDERGPDAVTKVADHITPRIWEGIQREFRKGTLGRGKGHGKETDAIKQAIAEWVVGQLEELEPKTKEKAPASAPTPSDQAALIEAQNKQVWDEIETVLGWGDEGSLIAAMDAAKRMRELADRRATQIERRGSDRLRRLITGVDDRSAAPCGSKYMPEVSLEEQANSTLEVSPNLDYQRDLNSLESISVASGTSFRDEDSWEASDAANWGEEPESDNTTELQSEPSPAPIPNDPQVVEASAACGNGTLGSAVELDPLAEATRALDLFESVGIEPTKLILRDDLKDARGAGVDITGDGVRRRLVADLVRCLEEKKSYILRMTNLPGNGKVAPGFFVDDVNQVGKELYRGEAFATFETSPGSFQLWFAIERQPDESDEDLYERICEIRAGVIRALKKYGNETANAGSGGASRWPGFRNWKPTRIVDGVGPMVRIAGENFGKCVTKDGLALLGLYLDEPPEPEPPPVAEVRYSATHGSWPRLSDFKNPERHLRDMAFCLAAFERGQDLEAITERLKVERLALDGGETTQGNGRKHSSYYPRTAKKAEGRYLRNLASGKYGREAA